MSGSTKPRKQHHSAADIFDDDPAFDDFDAWDEVDKAVESAPTVPGMATPADVAEINDDAFDGRVSSGGHNQYGSPDLPTEKQVGFLKSLLGNDFETQRAALVAQRRWTKKSVSALIDTLVERKKAAQPAADSRRPNRYASKCVRCGGWVEAEAGFLVKDANGKWAAEHKGECPAPQAKAEVAEAPEGMHRLDGEIYKVQIAVHGSGHPYAKRLVLDEHGHGEFVYEAGVVKRLNETTKMSLEEAKEFGRLYGVCCVCGATLTDERSIEAGIGPVCAGRF